MNETKETYSGLIIFQTNKGSKGIPIGEKDDAKSLVKSFYSDLFDYKVHPVHWETHNLEEETGIKILDVSYLFGTDTPYCDSELGKDKSDKLVKDIKKLVDFS